MDRDSLWLRLEPLILDLIKSNGDSRNSLGPKLGFSRNHLGRFLRTVDERGADRRVRPDFNLAFQIAEHYGFQPTTLLAPYAQDAPDVLLQILPCEPDRNSDNDLLNAIAALETRVVGNGQKLLVLWDERRNGETELARIYAELEELENRRHYANCEVAETCRDAILDVASSESGSFGYNQAIRLAGIVGIWGSVQRREGQLFQAREALRHSLILSRRLSDLSLYANQLQRAAYVFRELDAHELAVGGLREASELYWIDRNAIGAACTLIDRALVAAHRDQIHSAERLYETGLSLIPTDQATQYRLAAMQGLATCKEMQGDIEGALRYLNRALQGTDKGNRRLSSALLFTAANVERRLRHFSDAETKYWSALEAFAELEDPDSVLRVCLDLSVCLVQSGNQNRLSDVRNVVERHLLGLRNRTVLQHHGETLLRELSSDTLTVADLQKVESAVLNGKRWH